MSRSASLGCSLMRASSTKSMMSSKNGSSCLRISFRSCDSVLTGRLLGSNWVFGRIQFCHRWCPFFNLCGYALALMPDKYEIHTLFKSDEDACPQWLTLMLFHRIRIKMFLF